MKILEVNKFYMINYYFHKIINKIASRAVYIFRGKPVHNCGGISCKLQPCPNMAAITTEEVFAAVKNILSDD